MRFEEDGGEEMTDHAPIGLLELNFKPARPGVLTPGNRSRAEAPNPKPERHICYVNRA
jgi:hypothetical protein